MASPILILRDINFSTGGVSLLEGVELSLTRGEKVCLVGRNGSGKSTILKLIAGLIEADQGEVFVHPGVSIQYLPQEPDFIDFTYVGDFLEAGYGPNDNFYRCSYLLNQFGLDFNKRISTLSGGEARRVALVRALAPKPDILLLDEPTNHLDMPAIEWLEDELKRMNSAMIIISHDRRFLQNLTQSCIWICFGNVKRLDKGFSHFEEWRDKNFEIEKKNRHKLDRKISAEDHWRIHGISARRKRNQGRLRALLALREKRFEQAKILDFEKMRISESDISGKLVAEAKNLSKSFNNICVAKNLSLRIQRGDIIGLVGPNGVGKTTLLKLLLGMLNPDEGAMRLGANLDVVFLDQSRESLDPNLTLSEAITGGGGETVKIGGKNRHVLGYMRDFLFSPKQSKLPISKLSGGERGRLLLARSFAKKSNLLVLDEPTNDLDMETLDLLQEMLVNYKGTVLLVSHDRDFLDRTVTSIISSNGNGKWTEYAGGYSDMISQGGSFGLTYPKKKSKKNKVKKPSPKKNKLSYKHKYALENLPSKIEILEKKIKELQEKLSLPDYYAKNPKVYETTVNKLKLTEVKLAEAEDEWLSLELLKNESEKNSL